MGPPGAAALTAAARTVLRTVAIVLALGLAGLGVAQEAREDESREPFGPDVLAELMTEPPVGTPCSAQGAIVEIAGLGRAVYDRIAYDGATGEARLSGGVCVEVPDVGLRLRVTELNLTGLDPDGAGPPPTLSARFAVLDVEDWRLRVTDLSGPVDALELRLIVLVGPGLVGTAQRGAIAADGSALQGVSLATPEYLLRAREATLVGDELRLRDASGTSCTCGVERYRLVSRTLTTRLGDGTATLGAPELRIAGVAIPLGDEIVLGGSGPGLESPIRISQDDDLGTVAVLRLQPGDGSGARVDLGASSEPRLRPVVSLVVRRGGDVASVAADGRGLRVEGRRRRDVGGGAWVEAIAVSELRGDDSLLRAGAQGGWSGRATAPTGGDGPLVAALDLRAGAEIAVEPVPAGAASGPGPASPRTPLRAQLRLEAPLASWTRVGVRLVGDAAFYPGAIGWDGVGQAAATVAPWWRVEGGGARLTVAAERRWATGSTPFEFDELEPRARLTADGSATLGALRMEARAAWRFAPETPGPQDLEGRLSMRLPLRGGWRLEPSLEAELAGLAGGPAAEDWLEARLEAVRDEDTRFGVVVREGVDPWTLRRVEGFVQWPIDLAGAAGSVRLVPYLAFDVAGLLNRDGDAIVSGYGLRAYVPDCCGTLVVGYRSDRDGASVEVGVRLPPLTLGELPLGELPPLPPLYGDAP